MTTIKICLKLPSTISKTGHPEIELESNRPQALFEHLREVDAAAFGALFSDYHSVIKPKAFVSMFLNGTQVHGDDFVLKSGDQLALAMAIAGG